MYTPASVKKPAAPSAIITPVSEGLFQYHPWMPSNSPEYPPRY
jgi:hypothetical protein